MTPLHDEIKELMELLEKATPGGVRIYLDEADGCWRILSIERRPLNPKYPSFSFEMYTDETDAKLFAESRNKLPLLLDALEEAVEVLREVSTAVGRSGTPNHEAWVSKEFLKKHGITSEGG